LTVRQLDLFTAQGEPLQAGESLPPLRENDPFPFELCDEPRLPARSRRSSARTAPLSREQTLTKARSLAAALAADLGLPVRLLVTDNRSTMVSFSRTDELFTVRLHHMFLDAPPKVVEAIADYAGRRKRPSGAALDAYVRSNRSAIRRGFDPRAPSRMRTRGHIYDLREIYARLNAEHFGGKIEAQIGWARFTQGKRRRSIRMGVYDHQSCTIRVHPALDRAEVPVFFLEYIVFHEMLHQEIPGRLKGSRKMHHSAEFRAREKTFPEYKRALVWEKANLGMLLGKQHPGRLPPVD